MAKVIKGLQVELHGHNLVGPAAQADIRETAPGLAEKEFPGTVLAFRPEREPS